MENDNLSIPPGILMEIQKDVKVKNRIITINNITNSTNVPAYKLEDHPKYKEYVKTASDVYHYEMIDPNYPSYRYVKELLKDYVII